jgi:hypothetical protein
MNGPALNPEVERILTRYLQIQDEMRKLGDEKASLNQRLCTHLARFGGPYWFPVVGGQALKVHVRHEERFLYNEDLLRERLGERYVQILKPDPAKVRRHLTEVDALLRPALEVVGSPNRERVRAAVESGVVPRDAFNGAFEKLSATSVAVGRLREGDTAAPGRRGSEVRAPAARPGRPAGPPGWPETTTGRPLPRTPAAPRESAPEAAA